MWKFMQSFLESPGKTGAVVPSSKALARKMCEQVDFDRANTIVELGPGTGVITKELLRRMRPDCKLVALEINPKFCDTLRKIVDERLSIVNEDARKLSSVVSQADYVVSGLPLVAFGDEAHHEILKQIGKVARYSYIQFHYSPLGEKYLLEHFKAFERKPVLWNIPPAFVYVINLRK